MSASDKWGTYKTPCPGCKGTVEYWYYAPDCNYNPGSSGIQCKKCGKKFTQESWEKVEAAAKKRKRPVGKNVER